MKNFFSSTILEILKSEIPIPIRIEKFGISRPPTPLRWNLRTRSLPS